MKNNVDINVTEYYNCTVMLCKNVYLHNFTEGKYKKEESYERSFYWHLWKEGNRNQAA